jgi:hypothetical protein
MKLSSLLGPSPPDLTRQRGAGGWRVSSGSSSGAQRSTIVAVQRDVVVVMTHVVGLNHNVNSLRQSCCLADASTSHGRRIPTYLLGVRH